ncbi:MAG: OmpH family outer membrane protein [Synergistaceae bacterium]
MVSTKKLAVIIAVVSAFSMLMAGTAFADVVGSVNPQKIMFQHPKFAQAQTQIKAITTKKQNEAKAGIEKATDDKAKAAIFQKKRQEAAQEEAKIMRPLFEDINLAIRTVANAKKITVVVDGEAVFFGSVNITDDVINELKRKK